MCSAFGRAAAAGPTRPCLALALSILHQACRPEPNPTPYPNPNPIQKARSAGTGLPLILGFFAFVPRVRRSVEPCPLSLALAGSERLQMCFERTRARDGRNGPSRKRALRGALRSLRDDRKTLLSRCRREPFVHADESGWRSMRLGEHERRGQLQRVSHLGGVRKRRLATERTQATAAPLPRFGTTCQAC